MSDVVIGAEPLVGYSQDQMTLIAHELGIVMMNLLLADQARKAIMGEIAARDTRIELLTNSLLAREADVNRLRAEIGAKPISRRGQEK